MSYSLEVYSRKPLEAGSLADLLQHFPTPDSITARMDRNGIGVLKGLPQHMELIRPTKEQVDKFYSDPDISRALVYAQIRYRTGERDETIVSLEQRTGDTCGNLYQNSPLLDEISKRRVGDWRKILEISPGESNTLLSPDEKVLDVLDAFVNYLDSLDGYALIFKHDINPNCPSIHIGNNIEKFWILVPNPKPLPKK